MKRSYFYIAYDGPALEANEMDVRELAPALIALSDLLEETNNVLNQGKRKISLHVKGSFKTGCFGIEFSIVHQLVADLLNIFKDSDVQSAAVILGLLGITATGAATSVAKGLIHFIKWVKGRKITKIEPAGRDHMKVFIDSEAEVYERRVIDLFRNYLIRKAFDCIISKPLAKDGIESFACAESPVCEASAFVTVTKDEAKYFAAPDFPDEVVSDTTVETVVRAVGIVFKDDNKWRFNDGSSNFFAEVKDQKFLERVNNNSEFFAKDDVLRVQIRRRQLLTADSTIKTENTIERVIEHRSSQRQLPMPFTSSSGESDPPIPESQ